jgi:hypothetical protein
MIRRVQQAKGSPRALEDLFRSAVRDDGGSAFSAAIAHCAGEDPQDVLLAAWVCRLETDAADSAAGNIATESEPGPAGKRQHWMAAVGTSLACGTLFALVAAGEVPVPIPGVATPLFWIGWGPLAAVAILSFLAMRASHEDRASTYFPAMAGAVLVGLGGVAAGWGRLDDAAYLMALHLPFVAWAVIGGTVASRRAQPAQQLYAFTVRSMETLVVAGIFLGAGGLFGGLTLGIFEVFGITIPEALLRIALAFGIGVIPVLAVASVYDPGRPPLMQRATGLARILRIMSWLALPAALAVMAVYVFWFIPSFFWRAFGDREILIIYNATIMAILALLTAAVSPAGQGSARAYGRWLRAAVLSLGGLTFLLNAYALAAIASRTFELGLTPNRHAVLGWNLVTLGMLALVLAPQRRATSVTWRVTFQTSMARALVVAVAWATWVAWGLPLV